MRRVACLTAVALAGLQGCAGTAPLRPPAATPAAPTVSHDFTPLVLAPFGTAFKDMPVGLTEVLVFHQPDAPRSGDEADCFRPNAVVAFLGQPPTDHLLCFDHDRLKRVEASVALPAALAPAIFASACADWRRGDSPGAASPDACEGRQGNIVFSARRSEGPDAAFSTVSIALAAPPAPAPP